MSNWLQEALWKLSYYNNYHIFLKVLFCFLLFTSSRMFYRKNRSDFQVDLNNPKYRPCQY